MSTPDHLRSTLLSLWLGAALFFSFSLAPSVFAVLRAFDLANANEIAGTIVTRTLAIINVAGFIFGLVALLITFAFRRAMKGFALALQVLSLIVLVGTTAVGHSIVAARMRALRVAMVTIDLVPPDDPRRVAFAQLHVYSVALLTAAMIASAIAIVAILFSRRSVGR